jgi:hypothetical protein
MRHAAFKIGCSLALLAAINLMGPVGITIGYAKIFYIFPESACEGFFVKKHPLYYIFTPSHLLIYIFTPSHLLIYIFTPSHLLICIFTH